MERTLLNEIYAQWKSAKQRAQQECENRALFNMAEKYRACTMFKGTEDLEQIIRLFTSPQGVEFCQKYHFPDITTLRRFKQYDVERYGIYIDAGHIRLENERTVVLIGKTSACLSYDSKGRHEVILMQTAPENRSRPYLFRPYQCVNTLPYCCSCFSYFKRDCVGYCSFSNSATALRMSLRSMSAMSRDMP